MNDLTPDGLVAFLRAQLDDDEQDASGMVYGRDRALREVEAKRKILHEHAPVQRRGLWSAADEAYGVEIECSICSYVGDDEDAGGNRFRWRDYLDAPCPTLHALALPYSDHPDYRQEWKP